MNKKEIFLHLLKNKEISTKKLINIAKLGFSYLLKDPKVKGYPIILMVEPTNFCNLKCPLCPTGNGSLKAPSGFMSFENYKKIIDQLGDYLLNLLDLPVKNALKKDFETLKMNIKYKPTMAWSSLFTPYPKTDLANYSIKNGYFHGDFDKIPANNKIESALKFGSKQEKREIENLHKFFGITTQFPFLLPLVRLLIKFPSNIFYKLILFGYYGFTLKSRMATIKLSPLKIFNLARIVTRVMRE